MLLVFIGDRIKRIRGDESKFRLVSFFGMAFLADIMMEGEVEAESESIEKLSSSLLKLDCFLYNVYIFRSIKFYS